MHAYNIHQVHGFWIILLHRGKIHYKVLQDQLLEVLDNMNTSDLYLITLDICGIWFDASKIHCKAI